MPLIFPRPTTNAKLSNQFAIVKDLGNIMVISLFAISASSFLAMISAWVLFSISIGCMFEEAQIRI